MYRLVLLHNAGAVSLSDNNMYRQDSWRGSIKLV